MRSKTIIACALILATPAQAATNCLSRQSVGDVAIMLLPGIIDRVSDRCGPRLPASAFLKQPAARQLRDRVAAERAARTPSAARGFEEMSGGELPKGLSDATIVGLMSEGMPAELLPDSYLTQQTCTDADELLSAMAGMSVRQIGSFVSALLSLSKVRDPAICPQ
jgi:hypothetical protein